MSTLKDQRQLEISSAINDLLCAVVVGVGHSWHPWDYQGVIDNLTDKICDHVEKTVEENKPADI